jgi:hypothetical protein
MMLHEQLVSAFADMSSTAPRTGYDLGQSLQVAAMSGSHGSAAWAVGRACYVVADFELLVPAELRTALLAAVRRVSSCMGAKDVSVTLDALAMLAFAIQGGLRDNLLAAAECVSSTMDVEDVRSTLHALADLKLPIAAGLHAALFAAAQRVSTSMDAKDLCDTLHALVKLALPGQALRGAARCMGAHKP